MSDRRIVIDTSVLVSVALFRDSVPRAALDAAIENGQLLVSLATLAELHEVLRRPKFDNYVSQEVRLDFLASFMQAAEEILVVESIAVCRDPKDNKFLELAVSGLATCIISGDADLLTLHPFRGISISTPQAFLTTLKSDDPIT